MPTKALIDRQRIGRAILHAARTHAREVGERLNEALQVTVAEGETLADFVTLHHQLARYLEMRLEALEAADHAHLQELDDDREPRLRREEATDALYTKLIEVREVLRGHFGAELAAALAGIDGSTPQNPLALHSQAVSALERLRDPEPDLPPQRFASIQLDRNALADELQPFVDELGAKLEDVKREARERESTKGLRDQAIEAFDVAVGGVARILIGCDELAEFPHFAEKVRLTLPRRGGQAPEEDEERPDGPSGSEETPPPEPGPAPDEAPPPDAPGLPSPVSRPDDPSPGDPAAG